MKLGIIGVIHKILIQNFERKTSPGHVIADVFVNNKYKIFLNEVCL